LQEEPLARSADQDGIYDAWHDGTKRPPLLEESPPNGGLLCFRTGGQEFEYTLDGGGSALRAVLPPLQTQVARTPA
jgi:hypothetical protein